MLNKRMTTAICLSTLGIAISAAPSFADGQEGTVTASALNVRSGPSTSNSIITKAYKGDKVEILETSSGWHKIKLSNGKTGWSSGDYISISSSGSSSDNNSSTTGKTGTVTTSALNIRSGASTSHSIVTKAYKGDKVEILESSNGWYKVKLSNGTVGWGSGDYITTSSSESGSDNNSGGSTTVIGTGTVTTSALNIRSGASTSHSVITKAYKGEKVEILEKSSGWYRVKLSNGTVGWGSSDYISTSSNESSSDNNSGGSTTVIGTGTVTTSTLNIRSGASTSHSIVTKAYKGEKVEILEKSSGWYRVKLSNGTVGWGSSDYISTSSNESNSGNDSGNNSGSDTSSSKVQTVLNTAYAQIGKPYVWGAEGPSSFDCSGLTYYVYKQAGITLPRTSKEQSRYGTSVSKSNLQPGDLVFSTTDGSGQVSHVGIYVGDGYMIHCPKPGKNVEKVSMNNSYWSNAYVGARRVL